VSYADDYTDSKEQSRQTAPHISDGEPCIGTVSRNVNNVEDGESKRFYSEQAQGTTTLLLH
jgi:hypothetical protein